jgi:hypothetical protein
MTKKTVLQGLIESAWSDYCDLDYFIDDMTRGQQAPASKHVLKMAMKHLRDDMLSVHAYLSQINDRVDSFDVWYDKEYEGPEWSKPISRNLARVVWEAARKGES